ncbi:MAG: sulfatase-like hydrolase/transferase [Akkermansiaceae bacterium]|nr:sulfatase-like hydrolase/transferase [Akkermansiaceae bacterium]
MKTPIALLAACLILAAHAAAAPDKPNIVLVLFDDLGYGEPKSYRAASKLETPRLDRLAAEGMHFTDAHSAAAVCTPTRYGLLTGRYPSRIGQYGVLTTFSPPIIPESRLTLPAFLKRHGYQTACIGKWHLGLQWEKKAGTESMVPIGSRITSGPNQLGFDDFYGFTHARNIRTIIGQDRVVEYVTEVENQPRMISKAVQWLENREPGKPFFLYFPMCPPHTPLVPAPEFVGKSGSIDEIGKDPKYGDWLYQGDHMLGQLLDALDRKGLAANTMVIVTSDNGAAGRPYPPFRGQKTTIHEGGHRVPFIVRWPGKVPPGSRCDQTICLNDILATCADVLNDKLPEDAGEDSVSILPALLGTASQPLREATLHQSQGRDLAIRQGPWKLVFLKNRKRHLYHLTDDPGETKDLAAKHPQLVAQMTQLLKQYIAKGRSTPGTQQPSSDSVAWPMLKEKK